MIAKHIFIQKGGVYFFSVSSTWSLGPFLRFHWIQFILTLLNSEYYVELKSKGRAVLLHSRESAGDWWPYLPISLSWLHCHNWAFGVSAGCEQTDRRHPRWAQAEEMSWASCSSLYLFIFCHTRSKNQAWGMWSTREMYSAECDNWSQPQRYTHWAHLSDFRKLTHCAFSFFQSESQFLTFLFAHFSPAVFSLCNLKQHLCCLIFLSPTVSISVSSLIASLSCCMPHRTLSVSLSLSHIQVKGDCAELSYSLSLIQSCQLAACSSTARLGRAAAAVIVIWELCSRCWTFPPRHSETKTSWERCIFHFIFVLRIAHPSSVLSVVFNALTTYQTLFTGDNIEPIPNAYVVQSVVRLHLLNFMTF